MDCSSANLVVLGTRSAILVLCALAGIMCIYLGWRLYQDGIKIKTEGQVSSKVLNLKIASLGPGIFLVAFGIWLLVTLAQKEVVLESNRATPSALFDARPGNPIVRVQASAPLPKCPQCLLNKVVVRFGTGEQDISASDIGIAAIAAANGLRAAQGTGISDRQERARTIATLTRLAEIAQDAK